MTRPSLASQTFTRQKVLRVKVPGYMTDLEAIPSSERWPVSERIDLFFTDRL